MILSNYVIQTVVIVALATNCYVITCKQTHETVVIDAGSTDIRELLNYLEKENVKLKYIINTHGHADHIAGNNALKQKYPSSKILIHNLDKSLLLDPIKNLSSFTGRQIISLKEDEIIADNTVISFGNLKLKVLHTPGHSQGSISLLLDDKYLFCGDTLFNASIGRTDLPGGYYKDIESSIKNKFYILKDDCIVYPGHGEPTTIGKEKFDNPFVNIN
ncbi:MBL fold metallo-hydrolase [Candidatus Poribacteria bacterium]|nr:MBL fold metallo-hydrolase [Candidatus Poribacteria bacterium]